MDLVKVAFLSFSSLIFLFILSKLMGNKELSQLSMFDYIIGITIGSIAAEMATSLESSFFQPLLAMSIYALSSILISYFSYKSLKFNRIITGPSLILLDNDQLYRENFKKAKLDVGEFLMQCRINGFFNLSDIQTAIFEPNGKISFLPKSEKRYATPNDFNMTPSTENVLINVIIDGKVLEENLKKTGNNEAWLYKQLNKQNINDIKNIFLATCDNNNNLIIYLKNKKQNKHDFFN